jgi:hypothetical protein
MHYADNALGMGLAISSNIAQRFATAVVDIALRACDADEIRIVAAALACALTPAAHRRYYLIRQRLSVTLGCNCARLIAAMIYTDDLLAIAAGIDRLLRFLMHWTLTVDALGIQMASEQKRIISQTCIFIGFGLALALGFAYIPAEKVARGLSRLNVILSNEPVAVSEFRSFVGLLTHFQSVLAVPDSDLYAFHDALAAAGHGPGALIARTAALKSAATQWLAMLSSRAVAAFCPMPSLNVPSAVCRPTLHMFSDASQEGDSVGLGGYLHGFYWHATVTGVQRRCIAVLEFLALIVSWNTFLPHIGHADVVIHVDNANVVAVVNGSAHSASTRKCHTALLASVGWERRGDARTRVVYIRSAGNQQADALSRGDVAGVVELCRAAHVTPRHVPAVGGAEAAALLLGEGHPAAAVIDPLALARRNPPLPLLGRRIGEASNPGPKRAAGSRSASASPSGSPARGDEAPVAARSASTRDLAGATSGSFADDRPIAQRTARAREGEAPRAQGGGQARYTDGDVNHPACSRCAEAGRTCYQAVANTGKAATTSKCRFCASGNHTCSLTRTAPRQHITPRGARAAPPATLAATSVALTGSSPGDLRSRVTSASQSRAPAARRSSPPGRLVLVGGPAGRAPLAIAGPSFARQVTEGRAAELLDSFRAGTAQAAAAFGAVQEALAVATAAANSARAAADTERAHAAEQEEALESVSALVEPLQDALVSARRRIAELAAALADALATIETLRGRPSDTQAATALTPLVAPLSTARRIMARGVPGPAVTAPVSAAARDNMEPPPAPSREDRDELRGTGETPARADDTAPLADSPAAAPATTPSSPHEPPPSDDETPARTHGAGAPPSLPAAAPAETQPDARASPTPGEPRRNPQPPFAGMRVGEAGNPGPDCSPWRAAFESREWATNAALPAAGPAAQGESQRPSLALRPTQLSLAARAGAVGSTQAGEPARRNPSPWHAAYFGEPEPPSQLQSAAQRIAAQSPVSGRRLGAPAPQAAPSTPATGRASTVSPWASDPRSVRQRVAVSVPPEKAARSRASAARVPATPAAAAPKDAGASEENASASLARPPRPGDDIILAAVPLATKAGEVSAMKSWDAFRARSGAPRFLAAGVSQEAAEDTLCMFLLTLFAEMKPRRKEAQSAQPKSAGAVVAHVKRVHERDAARLPCTPRVQKLISALAIEVAKEFGPEALVTSGKLPMTLDMLLHARGAVVGREIAGRRVDWSTPFWTCVWAVLLLMWYMGARKSDVLPTLKTPFDKRRLNRAALTFGAPVRAPSAENAPGAPVALARAGGVRVRIAGTKTDQTGARYAASEVVFADKGLDDPADGAAALRAYAAACPVPEGVEPGSRPLFEVAGEEPITGELLDKILKEMLAISLGAGSPRYSMHSMRSGAATALRAAGFADSEICRAFRWASLPSMLGYARASDGDRLAVTTALAVRGPRAIAVAVPTATTPSATGQIVGSTPA